MSDWDVFSYTGRIKRRPTEYLQRDKEKQIPNAMAAFVSPLDEREEVEQRIYLTQSIYNATGIELDRFGSYVDLARGVLGDDEYRQEILRRRFTLGGSGTEPDITKLAQAVTDYAGVTFIEHPPASFIVHISGPKIPSDICQILDGAAMGGVRAYSTHDYGDGAFALAGINTSAGEALQVGTDLAMRAGAVNEIMGLNRGQAYIAGSTLAAGSQVGTASGGLLDVNGDILADQDDNLFYVGSADYGDNTGSSRLAGAMPKED